MARIEILAPVGSEEMLRAAVFSGADAVYLGFSGFNARTGAGNFDADSLQEAVRFCHARGVAVHVALNTTVYGTELPALEQAIRAVAASGADAVICQDLAVATLIGKIAPKLPRHGSTQMSVHTLQGALELKELGFTRVVLARELSLPEVEHITKHCGIETECFIHGALCMSVSGQCYMSAFLGGRSGNRGSCAPPTFLRKTLSKVFRSIYGLKATDVIGASDIVKQHYDILLVDEAHRLHQYKNIVNRASFKANCKALGLTTESDELDWIMQQCDCPILFYDKMQVVGPSGINIERFDEKMKLEQNRRLVTYYSLLTQMRVNGGNDYINLVNSILSGKCNQQACLENYDFKVMSDFNRFNNLQQKLEDEFTLSRMIAGYAWEWKSKKDKSLYDMELDGVKKQWNYRLENWVLSEGADKQVGCIHTIQGFDLNYGFVIMGNEIGYDPESKEIIVRPENYYDQNGRKTASKEELLEYIKHIYYVLMTRGIKGTYLYICDDNLRKYVSSIIGEI